MLIAIHPDRTGDESYSAKWSRFLENLNVQVKWVDLTGVDALEQVRDCDGVMWRWAHTHQDRIKAYRILHTIEHYLAIPVFPNHNTCWHYDEKITQHYIFQALNIPTPNTWIFWDKEKAIKWAKETKYPKVFKLSSGASASNVVKVNSKDEALKLINKMFDRGIFPLTMNEFKKKVLLPKNIRELRAMVCRIKHGLDFGLRGVYPPLPISWWRPEKGYVYFQEFLSDNEYDTRVTTIGNRAFALRRFNRSNDFRASGSGNFDLDPSKVDLACIRMAYDISKKLKFQSMAYDYLFQDKYPLVSEISYTFIDHTLARCPGYWQPDLTWVERKMWPEEAQVEDFIDYIQKKKSGR
jgi:glutathione synthase/RimK-type ligase-like ATP-grasp enzyme